MPQEDVGRDSPGAHAPQARRALKPTYITQHILPHFCGRSFLEPTGNLLVHLLVLMCYSPPLKGEMVRRPQHFVLFGFIFSNKTEAALRPCAPGRGGAEPVCPMKGVQTLRKGVMIISVVGSVLRGPMLLPVGPRSILKDMASRPHFTDGPSDTQGADVAPGEERSGPGPRP